MDITLPVEMVNGTTTSNGSIQIALHGNFPLLKVDIKEIIINELRIGKLFNQRHRIDMSISYESFPETLYHLRGDLHIVTLDSPHIEFFAVTYQERQPLIHISGKLVLTTYDAYRIRLEILYGHQELGQLVLDELDKWAKHTATFTLDEAKSMAREIERTFTSVRQAV